MKNAEFAVGSKIGVVNPSSLFYRYRGSVVEEIVLTEGLPYSWKCRLSKNPDGCECEIFTIFTNSEIVNIQKKFIDIEHIREEDIVVGKDTDGNDIVRRGNTGAFIPGDVIQITEKIDGANASVSWNTEDGKLEVFFKDEST